MAVVDQEMQEYLALKAAVKGEIRTAQGRTWRRQLQEVIDTRVVQPAKAHPVIAGEMVGAVAMGVLAGGHCLIGMMMTQAIEQGGEYGAMVQAMLPLVRMAEACAGLAVAASLACKGMSLIVGRG